MSPPRPPVAAALRLGGIGCLALAFVVLMARSYLLVDPPDPSRVGSAAYGHNHAGALAEGVVMVLSEAAALMLILRPWSYHRSWGRALLALAVFVPWAAIAMVLAFHAGGVMMLHLLWLLTAVVLVLGLAVSSGVAASRARRAERSREGSP